MSEPVIYGAAYSTYVRTVRMALIEKGVSYKLEPVDILAGEGQTPAHLARQPFGKIPAFEHDGLSLYETTAIARYVDDAFGGAKLQPDDIKTRARMNQIIGVVDSHAYQAFVWKIFIERNAEAFFKRPTDESAIAAAMPEVRKSAAALEAITAEAPFLCGKDISLADCWLVPVMAYFTAAPEGVAVLGENPRLSRWWKSIAARDSVVATDPNG